MKVGQVRLVKSQYGWHIIRLTGRERVHMTSTELQSAKATAFQNWLTKQEGILHIQRFVAVNQLPGLPSATATAIPQQIQQQLPQPTAPAPTSKKQPATKPASKSTTNKKP
jgi:hypothetical protein